MEAEQSLLQEDEDMGDEIISALPSIATTHYHAQDLENQVAALEILDETADDNTSSAADDEMLDIHETYNFTELQLLQKKHIAEIVKSKNLQELRSFGGVTVIAQVLEDGISCFDQEGIGQKKPREFSARLLITSFLGAFKNYTIILLLFSAILSLTFGIMEQGFGVIGCFDGVVVLIAMFILVGFATTDKHFRAKRFQKKLDNFWRSIGGKMEEVRVLRSGNMATVSAIDLQVGDVALLRMGDRVPADGLFAYGDGALVEELEGINTNIDDDNPFLFYGSKVINGNARMVVTSVGMDTSWGERMIQAMKSSENKCILETHLHKLDKRIQNFGIFVTILVFIWLLLRYNINGEKNSTALVNTILDAIKALITGSIFVGLLEGLPSFIMLASILFLDYKTLVGKTTARDHLCCVKIASVTRVCTELFGRLNEQEKEIGEFFVGGEFVCESSIVASNVVEDLCDGIGTLLLVPSCGCESKLMPLIWWAEANLGMKEELVSERCKITSYSGCNPFQECCKVQILKSSGIEGEKYWHFRGPPRDILSLCSQYFNKKGNTQPMDADSRMMFEHAIQKMLAEGEAIGYACGWLNEYYSDEPSGGDQSCGLIFLGMIGLKDKFFEETKRAVTTLKEGGIRIILVSGDDANVVENVAHNYGLLVLDLDSAEDHMVGVVKGEEFRAWSDEERIRNLEKISMIGNCLPSDKILLIKHLQENGEVVAFLGQGATHDAPGLKQADIGITFGTRSSEVAKECCDANLWDCDFSVVVDWIENGRCLYENIQNYIQLQLIINISSTLVNFTTSIVLRNAALTTFELLWLNFVVTSVGGMALLAIPRPEKVMEKLPVRYSSANLVTKDMLRNIVIQVSCQTSMFVTFQHVGLDILGESEYAVKSIIFNGLFICQICSIFMARMPEKKNILSGLNRGHGWFWWALVFLLLCQAVLVWTKRVFFNSPGLSWRLWGVCLLFAFICWLLDFAAKLASGFLGFFFYNEELMNLKQ